MSDVKHRQRIKDFLDLVDNGELGIFFEDIDKRIKVGIKDLRKDGKDRHDFNEGYLRGLERVRKTVSLLRGDYNAE